jgi:hypothetical protein
MGIRPNIIFENVRPKIGGDVKDIGLVDAVNSIFTVPTVSPITSPVTPLTQGGAVWNDFSINLSIGDMLSKPDLQNFNNFLKNIDEASKKLVVILKIIRMLTSDLKSISMFFKFAIKMIVQLLKDLVDSFISTGLYMCLIRPDKNEQDNTFIVPTWGNFEEFKRKIVAACLDINNPKSPARLNVGTTVGGIVIGGIVGVNDPKSVDSFLYNMQILGRFFGFEGSFPGPPKGVTAISGIYNSKTGIKVSWNKASSTGVTGYRVYRCQDIYGRFLPTMDDVTKAMAPFVKKNDKPGIEWASHIKVYDNDNLYAPEGKKFNNGKPLTVLSIPETNSFSIIDYDVVEGETYYYKVFSIPGLGELIFSNPYNEMIESPLASPAAGAQAHACIPISEISKGILSMEGDFIDEKDYKYQWFSKSLRTFLGPTFDDLFNGIDSFADKLLGMVSTSGDAISDYLDFFSKKIESYISILNTIEQVIEMLANFRLRGSVLLLNVPLQKGGIKYFTDTVTNSQVESQTFGSAVNNDQGAALASIEGYYFGLVAVYGIPDPSNYNQLTQPYKTEYNSTIAQLQASGKAIQTLSKLLTG